MQIDDKVMAELMQTIAFQRKLIEALTRALEESTKRRGK